MRDYIWYTLNAEQRKILSNFCKDIAVGWFTAVFAVPVFVPEVSWLTLLRFFGSMVAALWISLYLQKDYV